MGRIRTIKPEFHAHEELSALPAETHLLAAALVNYCDDEGFFNANPVLVKAGTNPLRTDRTKMDDQLAQLEGIGYIEIRREGIRCLGRVCNFELHQKVSHPTPSKIRGKFEALRKSSGEVLEPLRPELKGIEGNREGNREASTANVAVAASPPFLTFPLTQGKTHIVTQSDVALWREAYPGVDIGQELRRALSWLDAHPENRSTGINGSKQRIVKWLAREQDKGGRNGSYQQNQSRATGRVQQQIDELAKAGVLFANCGPESGTGQVCDSSERCDGRGTPGIVLEGTR